MTREVVPEREAKQGRSNLNVLYIMLVSLALMGIAWFVAEAVTGDGGVDRQAISPEATVPATTTD